MSPFAASLRIWAWVSLRHLEGHLQGPAQGPECHHSPLPHKSVSECESKVSMGVDLESGLMCVCVSVYSTSYLPKTHVSKLNMFNSIVFYRRPLTNISTVLTSSC